MRTNGQYICEKIIELREKIEKIQDELDEMESEFQGAEIEHPDYPYCIVDFILGESVYLYAEDSMKESYELIITFEEFKDFIGV